MLLREGGDGGRDCFASAIFAAYLRDTQLECEYFAMNQQWIYECAVIFAPGERAGEGKSRSSK